MHSAPQTSRDQITLLLDLLKRAFRHVWLVALIVIVGAGLSILLAILQKPVYASETVLLYQEKISQSVLQGRDVAKSNRSTGARFKEMLLSRTTLSAVISEFSLYPDLVEKQGTIAAAEKLRLLVDFSDRGAGTYMISYRGSSAEEAQKITARLAAVLQEKDETIRRNLAEQTKVFLVEAKVAAENTLIEAESDYAAFATEHPEFVATDSAGAGASIRAASIRKSPSGGTKLAAYQREVRQLKARIANPSAPIAAPSRRRIESPALQQAREQMNEAKRDFEAKSKKYTPKFPDVVAAKTELGDLTRRFKRLEAAEQAKSSVVPVSTLSATANINDLRRELSRVESLISKLKSTSTATDAAKTKSSRADALVNLETEHARLQRRKEVSANRLSSLEGKVFTAEITASSEFAEAAKLVIVDKAYLPAKPVGKGRKIIVIAGVLVFGFIGCGLALGLALIDDRIYRRADIDELGIAPVLIVIPKSQKNKSKKRTKQRGKN